MSGNSYGENFRITTFGESHGAGVGVVVDGVTPGVELSVEDIQKQLDRRKPGQSAVSTPRKESDTVEILSGMFEGKTTGTPIAMVIFNRDMRSKDYGDIKDLFRPGHADFTYQEKYGIRDYRGSGRASGRETAARVAGGAVARKLLEAKNIDVTAFTLRAGGVQCEKIDLDVIEKNPMRACDMDAAEKMTARVLQAQKQGDSVGGIVECRITGLPAGLGQPVFDRLDAELAKAVMSIGSVKAVEFGAGFACADMTGSEHNDEMTPDGFASNNAGGIIGGISTGQDVILRVAVKPTASVNKPQKTVNLDNAPTTVSTEGRHDPCICPRIVPVIEAMACTVIIDFLKRQAAMIF